MNAQASFLEGSSPPMISGDLLNDVLIYVMLAVGVVGVMLVVAQCVLASGILQPGKG